MPMQVELNGVAIGAVEVDGPASDEARFLITDPALENLSNAELLFYATANDNALVEIGNISLTAVPEPATFALLAAGALVLIRRRRYSA